MNNHPENKSQEDNNNGTIGREVEAEHTTVYDLNSTENEVSSNEGLAENERHWPHVETNITPQEAEQGAKNYPGERVGGQISHAENVEGTSEDDL